MALLTQAPKGTQDLLPRQAAGWQKVEAVLRAQAELRGFGELRTPVFEHTELFQRSVGETTDVVQKEMYTFTDKGGRSVTLRPEGTAGAVRALLEHAAYNEGLPQKYYYFTSCYRYEKPQAGRLREFHQFGVELFGPGEPAADAQVILMGGAIFRALGVKGLSLHLNSIGCPACRAEYHKALHAYFSARAAELCETCRGRLERNPMRILDCKNPDCGRIAAGAPRMTDYLCADCRTHFERVQEYLRAAGMEFTVDPSLVRGLDYYTRTVFEFISTDLGAQSTVLGGGRYDGLVEEMGGKQTPALGFAMGLERLMMVLQAQGVALPGPRPSDVYLACADEEAKACAVRLAEMLCAHGVAADYDACGRSLKAQMKYAGKSGARAVIVLGGDELRTGVVQVKDMATGGQQPAELGAPLDEAKVAALAERLR